MKLEKELLFNLDLQLFADDPEPQPEKIQSAEDYAEAIKNLKAKTVSKEEYEKVVKDRDVLTKALAGEGPVPEEIARQQAKEKADVKELRKKFLNAGEENLSNAEYVQSALDLRQAILDEGGIDPFLPQGAKANPTNADIAGAQKVADAFQEMLDAATDENGKVDPELFNAYIKKYVAEDSPTVTAKLRAAAKARR